MKNHIVFACVLACAFMAATASHAKSELQASWDKGLRFQSEDKSFSLKLGGRIQNDWAWFKQADEHIAAYDNWQDGTEFRRLRLSVSGTVYTNIIFKAQYEFAGAGEKVTDGKPAKDVVVKDMYIGYKGIPVAGTLIVGHQKEPFGLEELTSSNYITFMERSPSAIFDSERNTGLALTNAFANKRVTAHVGVFKETDDGGRRQKDGSYAATARVTALPWVDDESRGLVHVGAAVSHRTPKEERKFEVRPGSHMAGKMLSVGGVRVESSDLVDGEVALVYGPFSAQGEFVTAMLDAPEVGDPTLSGFYVYGAFFLTGESRAYKKSQAVFDRVTPKKDFLGEDKGPGAWEVAVRYAKVDLNDKEVYGGEMTDITTGVNWHLNPNTRVMFNYVYSKADKVGEEMVDNGAVNIFETRFQIDF